MEAKPMIIRWSVDNFALSCLGMVIRWLLRSLITNLKVQNGESSMSVEHMIFG